MNRTVRVALPLVVLALGGVATAIIVTARPAVDRQPSADSAPLVRTVVARLQSVRLDVSAQGTVAPATRSLLVAQVAGRIESPTELFENGALFRRGDLLLTIDDSDFRLAVAQAEAGVAAARVRLERELAEAELARREWIEIGEGEASPLTMREPQLAEARAALEGAEATLEQARLQLSRTRIRAPFDGRVASTRVDAGQFVSPGTPLAEIYSTDQAEVALPIAQSDLEFLTIGLAENPGAGAPPAELTADLGGAQQRWQGRVVRTSGGFDDRTRMLTVYVAIDDPLALASEAPPLPMGLFVDARIAGRTVDDVVVLPRGALRGTNQVLVIDGESRLRFREVDLLRVEGEQVVVGAGLDAGERVCISPLETVVDGMEVRILEDSTPEVELAREALS